MIILGVGNVLELTTIVFIISGKLAIELISKWDGTPWEGALGGATALAATDSGDNW